MKLVAVSEDGEHVGVTLNKVEVALILSFLGPNIPQNLIDQAMEHSKEQFYHVPIDWPDNTHASSELIMSMYKPMKNFLKGTK